MPPDHAADTVDPKLLEILVCPLTKGPLEYDAVNQELISRAAKLAYPIRDGERGWSIGAWNKTTGEGGTVIKVWGRNTSANVQKVMWAVAEIGLPYERIDIGGPLWPKNGTEIFHHKTHRPVR